MSGQGDRTDEQAWLSAARAELDDSVRTLDAGTVARLRAARLRALDTAGHHTARALWVPAAAAAAIAVMIVGTLVMQAPGPPGDDTDPIVMLDDGFELYENLEFYEWLEAQADENPV